MRQAYFALFEREAHEMIQKGVSVDELAKAYMENLSEQFGDAVELSDEFRWEWVSIPHIYGTPFYVYAYAFGQLLVLALYKQYQEEGESFKPRYMEYPVSRRVRCTDRDLNASGYRCLQPGFLAGWLRCDQRHDRTVRRNPYSLIPGSGS
jgi:oligoendopeptidase F